MLARPWARGLPVLNRGALPSVSGRATHGPPHGSAAAARSAPRSLSPPSRVHAGPGPSCAWGFVSGQACLSGV